MGWAEGVRGWGGQDSEWGCWNVGMKDGSDI